MERRRLEKIFGIERAKASERIILKAKLILNFSYKVLQEKPRLFIHFYLNWLKINIKITFSNKKNFD